MMCYFSKIDSVPFSKHMLWELYNNRPHWSAHKGEGVGVVRNSFKAVEKCPQLLLFF